MADIVPSGAAVVLPPGTVPPTVKLTGENQSLQILDVIPGTETQIGEQLVLYPDGYQKWHQAKDLPDLIGKIQGNLVARYGVTGFAVLTTPGDLVPGNIQLGSVTYGEQP